MKTLCTVLVFLVCQIATAQGLLPVNCYSGKLAPKSVITNGKGLFFAQNMMYEHSITVYHRDSGLIATLPDSVRPSTFGYRKLNYYLKGAPCEATSSHGGKYIWVSNYAMTGKGFDSTANDRCNPVAANGYDSSFVYKISTRDLKIKDIIKVGCVPKFLANYRDSLLFVSNWCSGNMSVINLATDQAIDTIEVKMYPRGIAFDTLKHLAYFAQMGTNQIACYNIKTRVHQQITVNGRSPRHLCVDNEKGYLYASLNATGTVVKINLKDKQVEATCQSGKAPRSMVLSKDGKYLYVVNYHSNTFSKIETGHMQVLEQVNTKERPIGICFDEEKHNVWVSCYSGYLQVFHDQYYNTDSLYGEQNYNYALVLGSFSELAHATKLMLDTQELCNCHLEILENNAMYRVAYLHFSSKEEALAAKNKYSWLNHGWVLHFANKTTKTINTQ
ncbi:hypothetical protein GC194_07590 [bacterium]|nr:hypothetical protein [bacterium]